VMLRLSTILAIALGVSATAPFDPSTLALVRTNLLSIATHSWELGTATQALTELEWPELSIYASSHPTSKLKNGEGADVFAIAQQIVSTKDNSTLPLIDGDGAVGDPASVGPAVLLAYWTHAVKGSAAAFYATDAEEQLIYLLDDAPRSSTGAISQRVSQVQLWADFMYMAPPFIAYFGVVQGGPAEFTLLQEAYDQCRLYRATLKSPNTGLWQHIVLGNGTDLTHWGTGNAWAAAGMMRVLQTITYSRVSWEFRSQYADLVRWVEEILTSAWSYQQPNGAILNTIDIADPTQSFDDASSTALFAATTYRLAVVTKDNRFIGNAEKAEVFLKSSLTSDGWLTNAVDPETFDTPLLPGAHTPEGQAFILLLAAAQRDYSAAW